MPTMYCVITADVNRSRAIVDRETLQQNIIAAIRTVNKEFADAIAVPFAITIGDEWQGMLRSLANSYEIVTKFREALDEVSVSYGIGAGSINTAIQAQTRTMDGEAFHRSRSALQIAKKKKREIIFRIGDDRTDGLLNAVCGLLQTIRSRWTDRQKEKILLYKEYGNETRVAQVLGVTQGDIHQALKAGAAKIYLESENDLNAFLKALK